MKNKRKNGWKIVGYVLIILFAFVFLFSRIVRPLYRYKHSSIAIQDNILSAENQNKSTFIPTLHFGAYSEKSFLNAIPIAIGNANSANLRKKKFGYYVDLYIFAFIRGFQRIP